RTRSGVQSFPHEPGLGVAEEGTSFYGSVTRSWSLLGHGPPSERHPEDEDERNDRQVEDDPARLKELERLGQFDGKGLEHGSPRPISPRSGRARGAGARLPINGA